MTSRGQTGFGARGNSRTWSVFFFLKGILYQSRPPRHFDPHSGWAIWGRREIPHTPNFRILTLFQAGEISKVHHTLTLSVYGNLVCQLKRALNLIGHLYRFMFPLYLFKVSAVVFPSGSKQTHWLCSHCLHWFEQVIYILKYHCIDY